MIWQQFLFTGVQKAKQMMLVIYPSLFSRQGHAAFWCVCLILKLNLSSPLFATVHRRVVWAFLYWFYIVYFMWLKLVRFKPDGSNSHTYTAVRNAGSCAHTHAKTPWKSIRASWSSCAWAHTWLHAHPSWIARGILIEITSHVPPTWAVVSHILGSTQVVWIAAHRETLVNVQTLPEA